MEIRLDSKLQSVVIKLQFLLKKRKKDKKKKETRSEGKKKKETLSHYENEFDELLFRYLLGKSH